MEISVLRGNQPVLSVPLDGPITAGRQGVGEPDPYHVHDHKIVLAPLHVTSISRDQLYFEPQPGGRVKIRNESGNQPVDLDGNETLGCKTERVFELPVQLGLDNGTITIRIDSTAEGEIQFQTLDFASLAPGQLPEDSEPFRDLLHADGTTVDTEVLLNMLSRMTALFYRAASSAEFFEEAVDVLAEVLRVDLAAGLLWEQNQWIVRSMVANESAAHADSFKPDQSILTRMRNERRTWFGHRATPSRPFGLGHADALVATPILDLNLDVIGALYGIRYANRHNRTLVQFSKLEARLIEMLAASVQNGIARLRQEKGRITLEQFFASKLAERIQSDTSLLAASEAEVTVLFCDIRHFSAISYDIGAELTIEWVGAVMNGLSECVADNEGVIVEYLGDALMAMWGAPDVQPDHARLACRAALQMLEELPRISDQWSSRIGAPTQASIGINSGTAFVGNIGSERRFQYGPLGNTVNLASRVQGATKLFESRLLITESTARELNTQFLTRRVASVKVVNIDEPVQLHEVVSSQVGDRWSDLKTRYETALDEFASSNFRKAASDLGRLLSDCPEDRPSLVLLSRVVNALIHGTDPEHPVWVLDRK